MDTSTGGQSIDGELVSADYISSQQVRKAFSRASSSYDEHAVLQREIGVRLDAHLNFIKLQPKRILDIGCGTGYYSRLLRQRYKKADIYLLDVSDSMLRQAQQAQPRRFPWQSKCFYLQADALNLPFAKGKFDLVTSNLTMQWMANPQGMMQEMRRVLAPEGLILFSTFGRRTLIELRQCLATLKATGNMLAFPDVTSLGNALQDIALEDPVSDSDLFTLQYPNVMALVRELKGMGASSSAIQHRKKGLYGRQLLRQLADQYQYTNAQGGVDASFEALYAHAWYKKETIPIHVSS